MEKRNPKVGDVLIAIDPFNEDTKEHVLILGNEYKVSMANSDLLAVEKPEGRGHHYFSYSNWVNYFKFKDEVEAETEQPKPVQTVMFWAYFESERGVKCQRTELFEGEGTAEDFNYWLNIESDELEKELSELVVMINCGIIR